jgi:hypothetical protein
VTVRRVALIGDVDGPRAIPGAPIAAAGDSRGNIYVAFETEPYRVHVFDSRGQPLEVLGSRGGGPGEFRDISAIAIDTRDSIFVFDDGNARISVFAPDGRFTRSVPLPMYVLEARLIGDLFILNSHVRTPELVGLPLHTASTDGARLISFGAEPAAFRSDAPRLLDRWIAIADPGSAWVMHSQRYRLERWTTGGQLEVALEREAQWFRPY